MTQIQIEFDNISKSFGDSVAVEPMSLEVHKGEFIAIMGSSGCGKTTTLRMLAGLETPTHGEIRLNGRRINELRPSERNTPMVWQTLALFPFMNVVKNVEFGLKMRGLSASERREKAMHWLARMEIADLAERPINQLSGGQKQRVALARALVTEPPVLLLDEPLSALDANLVVRMQGVLSRLQKELGITFVYVTHSQSEAFAMADRVVIMSKGVVEQVGSPRDVFRRPASRFVAEFVGSNNILAGTVIHSADQRVQVETAIGVLEAVDNDDRNLHQGQNIELVISADNIDISMRDDSEENSVQCSLVSEEFVGTVVTLLVETDDGIELTVQKQQKEIDRFDIEDGTTFWVSWSAGDIYVLPG
ncbi:MAG: ABC transporter ATP-binding protein [Pseudomonadota bacterium]